MTSRTLVCAITALALISCTTIKGHPDRTNDVSEDLKNLEQYFTAEKLKEYDEAAVAEKRVIRDEIVNGRLAAMDLQYGIFQQSLYRSGVGLNIGTDVVTLGLGAAGSVFSGGTSQILSAASAGTIGLKESVDKNLFFERTMPALLAQMAAQRKTVLARIRIGLNQDVQDYPLNQALVDLEDYYIAGTIPGAITGILEASGQKGAEAEGLLNTLAITKETVSPTMIAVPSCERTTRIQAPAASEAVSIDANLGADDCTYGKGETGVSRAGGIHRQPRSRKQKVRRHHWRHSQDTSQETGRHIWDKYGKRAEMEESNRQSLIRLVGREPYVQQYTDETAHR